MQIGANFDPFLKRSDRGYQILDIDTRNALKQGEYVHGDIYADITLIEYSDLECPFCARLHNAGTINDIREKYGDRLNFIYKHFPLAFHPDAENLSHAVECIAAESDKDTYYKALEIVYFE